MKNAPFAYQSQTGKWSIFIMNVENVSLKQNHNRINL